MALGEALELPVRNASIVVKAMRFMFEKWPRLVAEYKARQLSCRLISRLSSPLPRLHPLVYRAPPSNPLAYPSCTHHSFVSSHSIPTTALPLLAHLLSSTSSCAERWTTHATHASHTGAACLWHHLLKLSQAIHPLGVLRSRHVGARFARLPTFVFHTPYTHLTSHARCTTLQMALAVPYARTHHIRQFHTQTPIRSYNQTHTHCTSRMHTHTHTLYVANHKSPSCTRHTPFSHPASRIISHPHAVQIGNLPMYVERSELSDFDMVSYSFGDQEAFYLRGQWTIHRNSIAVSTVWKGCAHLSSQLQKELLLKALRARYSTAPMLTISNSPFDTCSSATIPLSTSTPPLHCLTESRSHIFVPRAFTPLRHRISTQKRTFYRMIGPHSWQCDGAQVAWVRRMESRGIQNYPKRFQSAEGCYSQKAIAAKALRIKTTNKQARASLTNTSNNKITTTAPPPPTPQHKTTNTKIIPQTSTAISITFTIKAISYERSLRANGSHQPPPTQFVGLTVPSDSTIYYVDGSVWQCGRDVDVDISQLAAATRRPCEVELRGVTSPTAPPYQLAVSNEGCGRWMAVSCLSSASPALSLRSLLTCFLLAPSPRSLSPYVPPHYPLPPRKFLSSTFRLVAQCCTEARPPFPTLSHSPSSARVSHVRLRHPGGGAGRGCEHEYLLQWNILGAGFSTPTTDVYVHMLLSLAYPSCVPRAFLLHPLLLHLPIPSKSLLLRPSPLLHPRQRVRFEPDLSLPNGCRQGAFFHFQEWKKAWSGQMNHMGNNVGVEPFGDAPRFSAQPRNFKVSPDGISLLGQ